MSNRVTNYDLLISCPGDVEDAIKIIEEVVDDFNQKFMDTLNIGVRTRYWKKSSFPQSGDKPQNLLNKQFIEEADLAVAIFKNRFGTSTDKFESGSEEEIEIMLNSGKQVFLYFDNSPVSPSEIDSEQYQKVQKFRDNYKNRGIYYVYASIDEFRKYFDAHITKYFLSLDAVESIKRNSKTDIKIKSYSDGKMLDSAKIMKFDMGNIGNSFEILELVKKYFKEISEYKVDKMMEDTMNLFLKSVVISSDDKTYITNVASQIDTKVDSSFFDLGNLKESIIDVSFSGKSLVGSNDEKAKYRKIMLLKKEINNLYGHIEIEEYYCNLKGLVLLISNDGKTFDEDIDVELFFPKNIIYKHMDLPVPDSKINLDDWNFDDIFLVDENRDFISYEATKKNNPVSKAGTNYVPLLFESYNFESRYRETLDEIFEYKYYDNEDFDIVKIHFDYLKQHQSAAFPTWIFIKDDTNYLYEIKYRINSKRSTEVKEGIIKVSR